MKDIISEVDYFSDIIYGNLRKLRYGYLNNKRALPQVYAIDTFWLTFNNAFLFEEEELGQNTRSKQKLDAKAFNS